jgi:peptidoglycan/xylan/chitin deacetylase (PgdA/CDA1 family)
MSLLVLMFHRGQAGPDGNAEPVLDAHFRQIAGRCRNVLPGEPLDPGATNVCLSFDDGYYDFYTTVFPLLQKHRLRALLAVVPSVVRDRVDGAAPARLAQTSRDAFIYPSRGGFCTWSELETMARSGHVCIAAHGYSHCRLDRAHDSLAMEIQAPKAVLESRLGIRVDSFVFPYGRFDARSLELARGQYPYVFRIGGASNRHWQQPLLYRVGADAMPHPETPFALHRRVAYRARFLWNRLRAR